MGILLAVMAALSYGTGDFLGGIGGRRSDVALIPIVIQLVGTVGAAAAVLVVPVGEATSPLLPGQVVAGIVAAVVALPVLRQGSLAWGPAFG
jgi:hypothetical protein